MKNSLLLLFTCIISWASFSAKAEERKLSTSSIEIQDSASFSEPEWVKIYQEDKLKNVNVQKMLAIKKARLGFLTEADSEAKDVIAFREDILKDLKVKRAEFSRAKSETEAIVKERNHLKESNSFAEDKIHNLNRSIGQGISKQVAIRSDILALKKRLSSPVYRMEIVSLSGGDANKIADKLAEFHSEDKPKTLKGVVILDREISGKLFVIHDMTSEGGDRLPSDEANHLRADNFL